VCKDDTYIDGYPSYSLESNGSLCSLAELCDATESSVGKTDGSDHGEKRAELSQGSLDNLINVRWVRDGVVKDVNRDVKLSKLAVSDKASHELFKKIRLDAGYPAKQ